MSATNIEVFDVRAEGDVDKIRDLMITKLRPQWATSDIIQTDIGGGFVNKTLLFRLKSDNDITDGIVVRKFGASCGFTCREREICAMQIAHHTGCFPKILGVFQNGILHQYAHGRCLEGWEITDPKTARNLARTLAQFHAADLSKIPLIDTQGRTVKFQDKFVMFDRFYSIIDSFPADGSHGLPLLGIMRDQVEFLETTIEGLAMPQVPCCHGDFHGRNVLYDDVTGSVNMVDFEFAGCNFPAIDIIYMMDFYNYRDLIPGFPNCGEEHVTDDVMNIWITSYLERKNELSGKSPASPTQEEVDKMRLELEIAEVMMPLVYASLCLTLSLSIDTLQLDQIFNRGMELFMRRKSFLVELVNKHKQLYSHQA